jgi:hypothetical protein
MIQIQFPEPDFKVIKEGDKTMIFDRFRKKYVVLTPEEWVRQNFMQYLVQVMGYPAALIAMEKEIFLGEMKKRFDIVVYSRDMKPWMLIECKEMNVQLGQQTLEQVLRYRMVIPADYLVITNGSNTFCCTWEKESAQWQFLASMPPYPAA